MRLRRKALAITLVVATLLGQAPFTTAAHATDPVDVEEQVIHDRLFSSAVRLRTHGPNGLKDMVLSHLLLGYRYQNPNATLLQLNQYAAQMGGWFDSKLTADDLARPTYEFLVRMLNVAATHPSGALPATGVKELLDATMGKDIRAYGNWADRIANAQFSYTNFDRLYRVQNETWGQISRLSNADEVFAQAWDGNFGARLGISGKATDDELYADPLIATYVNVQAIMDKQDQHQAFTREADRQLRERLRLLGVQNDEVLNHLRELNSSYPAVTSGPRPDVPTAQQEQGAANDRQLSIDGAVVAVEMISTLLGFADPRAGQVAAGVGKAAIQVATAISNYLPTIAGLGLGQALTSLSTAALTGNVLAAIGGLLPLFANVQSPEQLILDQLQVLRQDVYDLKVGMSERFDRLESALTTMYNDMMDKFDYFILLHDATTAQLDAIEVELRQLTANVDLWGAEILYALQQAAVVPMETQINHVIHYADKWGIPIPSYETIYIPAANELHYTATNKALHEPFVGPSTDFALNDPMVVLDKFSANGAIGYLQWYASNNYGWQKPQGVTAPANPKVWTTAARALAMLESENPAFARQSNISVPTDVVTEGEKILNAMRAFSTPRAQPGPGGTRTNALFTNLMDDYRAGVQRFSNRLEQIEEPLLDHKSYNMFDIPEQTLAPGVMPADPAQVGRCTGTGPQLTRPAEVTFTWTPGVLALASYAHPDAPQLKLCYEAALINENTGQSGSWEITTADLEVVMKVRLQWGGQQFDFRTWRQTWYAGEVCRQRLDGTPGGSCKGVDWFLQNRWNSTYLPRFAGAVDQADYRAVDAPRARMVDLLAGKQAAYYTSAAAELADPRSELAKANANLTRVVRLLQAYTQLGFARTLEQDDLMKLVLFGTDVLPADLPDSPMITAAFQRARDNFALCHAPEAGAPCAPGTGPFYAQSNHPWNAWNCPTIEAPRSGDLVGDCLFGNAYQRMNLLGQRYEDVSQQLFTGPYTEGMPQVREVIDTLSTMSIVVRAQPAA